jgi:hypothetical protein
MKYIKKLKIGSDFNLLSFNDFEIKIEILEVSLDISKIKSLINYYVDIIEINEKIRIDNFFYIKNDLESEIYTFLKDNPKITKEQLLEYEKKLASNQKSALWYTQKITGKPFPLGEDSILKDNGDAYWYAKNILENRWEKLEKKLIAEKDIKYIKEYNSRFFKNQEWPEIEEVLIEADQKEYEKATKSLKIEQIERLPSQIKNILLYCEINLGNQRFQKAEKYILQNPKNIIEYVEKVVQGPWKEGEKALRDYYLKQKTDSSKYYIFNYLNISRQPSKILEEFIDITYHIIKYCKYNLNGKRFLSGEKHILNLSVEDIYEYIREIVKGPWPEAEPVLLESKSFYITDYANTYLKKPWREAEPLIINLNHYRIADYVKKCLKGERFKLAEPDLMNNYNYLLEYIKSLKDVFPEGINKLIDLNIEGATEYICNNLKKRWEPLERKFLEIKDGKEYLPVLYSKEILKKPWPEATEVNKELREKIQEKILKNDNLALLEYVTDVYKKPVPEFENLFNERYKEYYVYFVKQYNKKSSQENI